MIVIEDNKDLFSLKEKQILIKRCLSFKIDDIPELIGKSRNFYVREHISIDDKNMQPIILKINNYLNQKLKSKIRFQMAWINKITNQTNQNDKFHHDESDITFLMYLNDEFTGGEYEYFEPENKKKEKLKPKKYLSIITDKTIEHRVNPVLDGERYSMVFFYDFDKKVNKTLI
jgi:hypothetical protein